MEFEIKKCKTKAAYSAKPLKNTKLDLNKIKKKFKVVADTPIVLVISKENAGEIIVHNHGEILFKTLEDEQKINYAD